MDPLSTLYQRLRTSAAHTGDTRFWPVEPPCLKSARTAGQTGSRERLVACAKEAGPALRCKPENADVVSPAVS
jgi:hypothetical protein